ncbi:MAG: helix-turn-helix transcriptional regulator [Clostridia bacterium]|nr:helix-turn-helix transcriptional regulator [Clostridia bacterium]MDE7214601.1 helix-turn-helix transcriptional regulator [Clostridia bacterium]
MELCTRLRELRLEQGLTLKQVSSALQLTLSAYANYERGIREPSVAIIKRICAFYNVSSDYLLGIES